MQIESTLYHWAVNNLTKLNSGARGTEAERSTWTIPDECLPKPPANRLKMSRSCGVGLEDAHRGHLPAPAPGKKQAPAARRSGEEEEEDRRQAGGPAASARVAGGVASAGEGRRLGRQAAWRPRGRGGGGGGVRGGGARPACDGSAQLRENEKKWVGPSVGSPNRRPPNWGVG